MQKGFVLFFLCLGLLLSPVTNGPAAVGAAHDHSGMRAGLAVYNLTENKPLYAYQAEKSFVPASTLKLVIAAASLARLTPGYSFKTELFVDGKVSGDGTLKGNLVLKGFGDPSFGLVDLAEMVQQLKLQTGIQRINGDLVLDESYFDGVRLGKGWMWDDEIWSYSPSISALALERNQVELQVAAGGGAVGARPLVHYPLASGLRIENQAVISVGAGAHLQFQREPGENTVKITGSIGRQAKPETEELAVMDPALFLGEQWKAQLAETGIALAAASQVKKGFAPTKEKALLTHFSDPLQEIATHLNKESDNLYAEMLLKTLGAVEKGEGSFKAGLQVLSEYLREAGIPGGYTQVDGSGLSRLNRITPEQLLRLLVYVEQQPYGKIFEQTLPIAGVDGTLEKRWTQSAAKNNLKAKTGSMSGVYNIAGYLRAENGDKLAVALFLNGISDREEAVLLQDKVVKALVRGDSLAPFDHYPFESGGTSRGHQKEPGDREAPGRWREPREPEGPEKWWEPGELGESDKLGELEELGELGEPGEPEGQGGPEGPEKLAEQLDALFHHPDLRAVSPGIMIQSVDTGKLWYVRNEHKLLTPGSVVKVLTTFAARKHLGPDYTFRTAIYLSKPPVDGAASGDLLIKGDGDPSLNEQGIRRLIQQLPARQWKGNILVDDSYFDQQRYPLGWTWDGESREDQPPIGALSVNRNLVDLQFQPGSWPGAPVQIRLFSGAVEITNNARTSLIRDHLEFQRIRGKNRIIASGEMPLFSEPKGEKVPIADPAMYAGEVAKGVLLEKGMVSQPAVKRGKIHNAPSAVLAAEIRSEPLKRLLKHMNQEDDHFYAEMIIKTLGLTLGDSGQRNPGNSVPGNHGMGKSGIANSVTGNGGTEAGLRALKQALAESGIESAQLVLSDGSGLSRYNLLAAEPLTRLLVQEPSLARMFPPFYKERIHGIHRVMEGGGVGSFAGYVQTEKGERVAVTILLNGWTKEERTLGEAIKAILEMVRRGPALP